MAHRSIINFDNGVRLKDKKRIDTSFALAKIINNSYSFFSIIFLLLFISMLILINFGSQAFQSFGVVWIVLGIIIAAVWANGAISITKFIESQREERFRLEVFKELHMSTLNAVVAIHNNKVREFNNSLKNENGKFSNEFEKISYFIDNKMDEMSNEKIAEKYLVKKPWEEDNEMDSAIKEQISLLDKMNTIFSRKLLVFEAIIVSVGTIITGYGSYI